MTKEQVHTQGDVRVATPPRAELSAAPPPKRRLAVALLLFGLLAAVVALLVKSAEPPPLVGVLTPQVLAAHAKAVRDEARDACAARNWGECLDYLNEATELDPTGDESPEVQAMRRGASAAKGGP